jgi:DNA-binding transcriptional MerR regulator
MIEKGSDRDPKKEKGTPVPESEADIAQYLKDLSKSEDPEDPEDPDSYLHTEIPTDDDSPPIYPIQNPSKLDQLIKEDGKYLERFCIDRRTPYNISIVLRILTAMKCKDQYELIAGIIEAERFLHEYWRDQLPVKTNGTWRIYQWLFHTDPETLMTIFSEVTEKYTNTKVSIEGIRTVYDKYATQNVEEQPRPMNANAAKLEFLLEIVRKKLQELTQREEDFEDSVFNDASVHLLGVIEVLEEKLRELRSKDTIHNRCADETVEVQSKPILPID